MKKFLICSPFDDSEKIDFLLCTQATLTEALSRAMYLGDGFYWVEDRVDKFKSVVDRWAAGAGPGECLLVSPEVSVIALADTRSPVKATRNWESGFRLFTPDLPKP